MSLPKPKVRSQLPPHTLSSPPHGLPSHNARRRLRDNHLFTRLDQLRDTVQHAQPGIPTTVIRVCEFAGNVVPDTGIDDQQVVGEVEKGGGEEEGDQDEEDGICDVC